MIEIPFNPNIFSIGNFVLSWHGLLSVLGIVFAVVISYVDSKKYNFRQDFTLDVALVIVITGLIGARIVHVVDHWDLYRDNFGAVFNLTSGGIGWLGALIGGALGASLYLRIRRTPTIRARQVLDITAPAVFVGHVFGRIGDIINGEHCSIPTDLPWGWIFTHPDSPGRACITNSSNLSQGYFPIGTLAETPVHPVIVYEQMWSLLGVAIIYIFRRYFSPGTIAGFFFIWYGAGRFAIQFLRLDPLYFGVFQEAHILSLVLILLGVVYLIFVKSRFTGKKNWVQEGIYPQPKAKKKRRRGGKIRK